MAESSALDAGEPGEQPRTGVSGMAIAALGTSMAVCCPLLPLAGMLLGLRALIEIRAHPQRGGRNMARAAIWIGAIAFLGWVVLLVWWNGNVRTALLHGPQEALRAGMTGDLAAFRGEFIGPGSTADDTRVQTFIAALSSRYGTFVSAAQDDSAPAPTQSGGRDVVIPYVLTFDRGDPPVKAEVHILLFAKLLSPRLQSIIVKDAERGDLAYP